MVEVSGGNDDRATTVVVEFLSIIREYRSSATKSAPTSSPFQLMKSVWKLILSVVSLTQNGAQRGQELASKFDAFLPEGYSMVSPNLLLLEGHTQRNDRGNERDENDKDREGWGCARTNEVYQWPS